MRTIIGALMMAAGVYLTVLATLHPSEHHPAWWLIAGVIGLGGVFFDEVQALAFARAATDFLPWRGKGS